MIIICTSPISGITRSVEIPCTQEQMDAYRNGALIQDAFPNLTADQREFILTGITKEEWDDTFAGIDDLGGQTDAPAF